MGSIVFSKLTFGLCFLLGGFLHGFLFGLFRLRPLSAQEDRKRLRERVCVCVCERERERARERERERERERDKEKDRERERQRETERERKRARQRDRERKRAHHLRSFRAFGTRVWQQKVWAPTGHTIIKLQIDVLIDNGRLPNDLYPEFVFNTFFRFFAWAMHVCADGHTDGERYNRPLSAH